MIYVLPDDLLGSERLAEIKCGCGDPEYLEMNTTVLDGQRLALDQLSAAVNAHPFLAQGKRLVVVRRLLAQYSRPAGQGRRTRDRTGGEQALVQLLEDVPDSTELVFVEETPLNPSSALHRAISRRGEIVPQRTLGPAELAQWIRRRVRQKGGRIDAAAVGSLVSSFSSDLRQLDAELEKLVVFADGAAITGGDVRALVPEARQASIFAFVDSLGLRDRRRAFSTLGDLLAEGEPVPRILVMIGRQLRLLLITQDYVAAGAGADRLASRLRVSPRVARNLIAQARRFRRQELLVAYRRLLEADQTIKTTNLDDEVVLDLLIADLTGVGV